MNKTFYLMILALIMITSCQPKPQSIPFDMFADQSFSPSISVSQREIHLDKDGNSAIVMDQFFFEWNKKIPVRHIAHFVRTGDQWICNFLSTTYVPNDEDMGKIFNALK